MYLGQSSDRMYIKAVLFSSLTQIFYHCKQFLKAFILDNILLVPFRAGIHSTA